VPTNCETGNQKENKLTFNKTVKCENILSENDFFGQQINRHKHFARLNDHYFRQKQDMHENNLQCEVFLQFYKPSK
jgi:hypothetical protein